MRGIEKQIWKGNVFNTLGIYKKEIQRGKLNMNTNVRWKENKKKEANKSENQKDMGAKIRNNQQKLETFQNITHYPSNLQGN